MVHRARLVPRLVLVAAIMGTSFLVTGLVVWFAVVGTADHARAGVRNGSTSFTAPASQPISVPQGWPDALTPLEGAEITSSVTSGSGTPDEQLVMVYGVGQEAPAVAEALRAQLTAAGMAISTDAIGADGTGSLAATGGGREGTGAVSPDPTAPGSTTVSWVVRVGPR